MKIDNYILYFYKNNDTMNNQDTFHFIDKIISQKNHFDNWLKYLLHINIELNEEYNSIYQQAFYVKLYEMLTNGLIYAEQIVEILHKTQNDNLLNWYQIIVNDLTYIKTQISEKELALIEYKRHRACHIFANAYEIQITKKYEIKRPDRFYKWDDFTDLLIEHGSEKEIDKYLFKKISILLSEMQEKLENNRIQQ